MAKILVVDDEASLRDTISLFLEREGHVVVSADSVRSAMDYLIQDSFDLVLTDIIMPGGTGLDLLKEIHSRPGTTQVLIMTGEPTVETTAESLREGASDYISKPITRNGLLRSIRHALEVKALQDDKAVLEGDRIRYLAELEKLVDARTQQLQKALQGSIHLIASAVELRDPYTAGHQRRVGNLAAEIAILLGHTSEMTDIIRIGGYVHDIGKLVVPTEILTKPSKLSDLEFGFIRVHPNSGYEMLRNVEYPGRIAEIVRQHHERLNGSGYPFGLTSDHILTEAKIIAVADVLEAMVSHRPYRPALDLSIALDELQKNSGILYDPATVRACVSLFSDQDYQLSNEAQPFVFSF
jgi:putative two-component system response regulator